MLLCRDESMITQCRSWQLCAWYNYWGGIVGTFGMRLENSEPGVQLFGQVDQSVVHRDVVDQVEVVVFLL